MKTKDPEKILKEIIEELLELLEIKPEKLEISQKEDYFTVDMQASDSAALIGYHGDNLSALQLIIRLIAYNKTGQWLRVVLNVNDWREQRQDYLQKMASNLAQKVKFSGQEAQLPLLSPGERRIIHMYLSDHPGVETFSEGEGRDRRLVIKPKN